MPMKTREIQDIVEKSVPVSDSLHHIAFYKFVKIDSPGNVANVLRNETCDLLGHILVATEGINGVLAGTAASLDRFEVKLKATSSLAELFSDIIFKRSTCRTPPFARMKIHVKDEIVALGIKGIDATKKSGIDVAPADWRRLISEKDVVVIDNRNSFEFRLGRFHTAIDPEISNFRDLSQFVFTHLPEWKKSGKRIAMYCTGGIRCEKTSAWMCDFDIPVYQLEGGILNYFQTIPDAERDWDGECFVFDNRIALDTTLSETATTAEDVYTKTDESWRLERAQRLGDTT